MYVQRIIHVPALGKNAALRAALEERNKAGNALAPHALSMSMFAPEPAFIDSIRFESLAAIEAYQENPARATWADNITPCLSRPQSVFLYEELGQPQAAMGTPPKYIIRNRYAQAPGKGRELQAVLQERVEKTRTPGLLGARLSRQVASLDGPAFAVSLYFPSMAAIDEFRAANDKDPTLRTFQTQVAALVRAPMQQRINRLLIPFSARA